MSIIPLKTPVTVDGKEWTQVDFDPSLDALKAFNAALARGMDELEAMVELLAADGDTPLEVAGKIRVSGLQQIREDMAHGPLAAGSPALEGGEG